MTQGRCFFVICNDVYAAYASTPEARLIEAKRDSFTEKCSNTIDEIWDCKKLYKVI